MDCHMPVMDGYRPTGDPCGCPGAARPIIAPHRQRGRAPRHCLAAGMDDFPAKPYCSSSCRGAVALGCRPQRPGARGRDPLPPRGTGSAGRSRSRHFLSSSRARPAGGLKALAERIVGVYLDSCGRLQPDRRGRSRRRRRGPASRRAASVRRGLATSAKPLHALLREFEGFGQEGRSTRRAPVSMP